ncbi:hypothetical protein, partial [Oenococcus oeni]
DLRAFKYIDKVRIALPEDVATAINVDKNTEVNRLRLLSKSKYIIRWKPVYGKKISYSLNTLGINKIDSYKSIYHNRSVSYIHNIQISHIVAELISNNPNLKIEQFKLDSDFRTKRIKMYHRPDILINNRIAIEVELNRKSPSRLKAILNWYQSEENIKKVIYFTPLTSVKRYVSNKGGKFNASSAFLYEL